MPELAELPPMLQVIATMVVIIAGGGAAFFGFTKKWLEHLSPQDVPTKDTVVVSGTFADGKPIADLTHAVKMLTEQAEQAAMIAEGHRRCVRDNTDQLARKIDSDAQLGQSIDLLIAALERKAAP
jgi:hypothetical protein